MSKSARCDLNSKGNNPELLDTCWNSDCKGQNLVSFAPTQFQFDVVDLKKRIQKALGETKKHGFVF